MRGRFNLLIFVTILLSIKHTSGDQESRLLRRQKRIVGGVEAAQPPADDPVVFVSRNGRDARIYGNRDEHQGFYIFRGIRFGEPPVGRHRFQRPRAAHLDGDLNATSWGPPCPQPDGSKPGNVIGSEDCLFLNIFTPALPDGGDGYPVLIWIHGGGFRRGAACQYEMRNLIKKKMVVVSIQYRLGSLGFLSTGTQDLPGNNGMFDMTLAVNWIKDHIKFFGGDPTKIIAFGHGTGASSALMLSLSKLTQSFFSGIIAMSGSILSNFAVDRDPMASTKAIAASNNCPTEDTTEMIRCLRELPVENLVSADSVLESIRASVQGFVTGLAGVLGPGPVIDGKDDLRSLPNFMTQEPASALRLGSFPKIPLLTGVMKDETAGAIFGQYREEVQSKVQNIPNFLNENLIKNLQSTIPRFGDGNSSWQFVPAAFSKYLNIPGTRGESGTRDNVLGKVAEVTGDALFNAPAFLTSQEWSKKAKTFLYSFDHTNSRNSGHEFLAGLPLVNAKENTLGVPSHGDDLGYIFGGNTIFGKPLADGNSKPVDPEDEKVTEVFTGMIADFARNGEVSIPETNTGGISFLKIPSFAGSDLAKANPFVSVSSKLKLNKNFRYCEMGLWTGLVQRLQSASCGLFKTSIVMIQNTGKETAKVAEKISHETLGGIDTIAKGVVNPVENIAKPVEAAKNIAQGFVPGMGSAIRPKSTMGQENTKPKPNAVPSTIGGLFSTAGGVGGRIFG